jgi:hypothetical protein
VQAEADAPAAARAHAAGPEPSLSALDATALLTNAARLLTSGEGLRGPADDLATAYAQWVYNAVVADRAARDSDFRVALLSQLRDFLMAWPGVNTKPRTQRAVARLLAGWTFDALPEPLRDALTEDRALMRRLGRAVTTSLAVGRWHIASRTFAQGAAILLAGAPTTAPQDLVMIPALGSDPPVTLTLARTGPTAFTLASSDGGETIQMRDLGGASRGMRGCAAGGRHEHRHLASRHGATGGDEGPGRPIRGASNVPPARAARAVLCHDGAVARAASHSVGGSPRVAC